MKKPFIYLFCFLLLGISAAAQKITPADLRKLKQKEDSLQELAKNLIIDSLPQGRMRNDSLFIRTLVRTLQIRNSFYYPLDSVIGVSKVYSPDSTFRILSWSLSFDDYYSRQRATIQFRTPDGSLKMIPLRDASEFTDYPEDSVRSKDNWIGAVYYRIIKTEHNGRPYYTLFGYDPNSVQSNRKWIEVMTFNEQRQPVFGGKMFTFSEDTARRDPLHRFWLEYKKEASTFVNYDDEMQMILYDHLISESDEPDKPQTFIPDGDYEGFKWKNGKWVHVEKVFHQKLEDGQAPVPDPIRDDKGTNNESKLKERSDKNKAKKPDGNN